MAEIVFDHVTKVFQEQIALEDISFQIEKGEFVFVTGKSGAGKSTLLELLIKQQEPTAGNVFVFQKALGVLKEKEIPHYRRRLGIMSPEIGMLNNMTVYENVALALYAVEQGGKGMKRKIMRALGLVGIAEKAYAYPKELSGGEQARMLLARAMAVNPDVLIADEPTTALDVTIQAQILELMKKLQKTNQMGIIFITHNLGVVAEICDKVSVMYAGKMVEQGPVDDIFYAPGHPYTRGLLRSMPRVDAESYERLIPIEGTPVDMLNPPEGCPFAPRCESAMKICLQKMPPYVELGDNHRAACWLCVQEQMKAQKAAEKNNEKTEAGSHE